MRGINMGRLLLGGVVAGIIGFFGDGVVHGMALKPYWQWVMEHLHLATDSGERHPLVFLAYDLAKGFGAVGIYAGIRPRFGAGAMTAIMAGLMTWALTIPVPLLGMAPMHIFSKHLLVFWSLYGAVPIVAGALVGCALYKEATPA
jgi:hypothetical protein